MFIFPEPLPIKVLVDLVKAILLSTKAPDLLDFIDGDKKSAAVRLGLNYSIVDSSTNVTERSFLG